MFSVVLEACKTHEIDSYSLLDAFNTNYYIFRLTIMTHSLYYQSRHFIFCCLTNTPAHTYAV